MTGHNIAIINMKLPRALSVFFKKVESKMHVDRSIFLVTQPSSKKFWHFIYFWEYLLLQSVVMDTGVRSENHYFSGFICPTTTIVDRAIVSKASKKISSKLVQLFFSFTITSVIDLSLNVFTIYMYIFWCRNSDLLRYNNYYFVRRRTEISK